MEKIKGKTKGRGRKSGNLYLDRAVAKIDDIGHI